MSWRGQWIGTGVLVFSTALAIGFAGARSQHKSDESLKTAVLALLTRVEKGNAAERHAAEWDLLRLGAGALAFFPTKKEIDLDGKEPLEAIRATLEELRPRLFSSKEQSLPLPKALELLRAQTGMILLDRRQSLDEKAVNCSFKDASYWELAERLAGEVKGRISLYQPDGQVAIVDGPPRPMPVALQGFFRIALKRIGIRDDLDAGKRMATIGFELAWEPRFRPFLAEAGAMKVRTSGKGKTADTETEIPAHGLVFVHEHNAREFEISFPAPPRSAEKLNEIRGHFVVLMPSKKLNIVFRKATIGDTQTEPGGVSVKLTDLTITPQRWTIELTIQAPAAGPVLESYQQWLGGATWLEQTNCQFDRLVDAKKEVLRADPLRTQVVSASRTQAVVRYQFSSQNGISLKDFASWRMAVQTPGRLVEVTVPFRFENVDLP